MSAAAPRSGRIAFFDVDETLITVKSMFRFLRYHLRRRGLPDSVYQRIHDDLAAMAAAGTSREESNLAYYRVYAGQAVDDLTVQGREWFAEELGRDPVGLFEPSTTAALARHRSVGDLTVLVSGSFRACLDPIAEHLGADIVACTVLEQVHGSYTGAVIGNPVIGAGKADAVHRIQNRFTVAPEACTAYGDHASDLAMLESVGQAVVVGNDPVLTAQAAARGWQIWPASAPLPI